MERNRRLGRPVFVRHSQPGAATSSTPSTRRPRRRVYSLILMSAVAWSSARSRSEVRPCADGVFPFDGATNVPTDVVIRVHTRPRMRRSASQVARAMSLRDIDAQEDVSFTVREPTDEDQGPDFHYAVVPDEPLMAGRRYRFRSAERDELPPGCDGSRNDWSEASTVEFAVHPAPRMLKTWIGDPMLDPLPEHGERRTYNVMFSEAVEIDEVLRRLQFRVEGVWVPPLWTDGSWYRDVPNFFAAPHQFVYPIVGPPARADRVRLLPGATAVSGVPFGDDEEVPVLVVPNSRGDAWYQVVNGHPICQQLGDLE